MKDPLYFSSRCDFDKSASFTTLKITTLGGNRERCDFDVVIFDVVISDIVDSDVVIYFYGRCNSWQRCDFF